MPSRTPRTRRRGASRGRDGGRDGPRADDTVSILGPNAVRAALDTGQSIERVYLHEKLTTRLKHLVAQAERAGVPVTRTGDAELVALAGDDGGAHQGVVAVARGFRYADASLLAGLGERPHAFVISLDGVEDPRNLGAVIRVAAAVGADAVCIPGRRAAPVTPAAIRASAGTAFLTPIVQVTNTVPVLTDLKAHGFWIIGASSRGESLYADVPAHTHIALVLGGEGKGLRPLVAKTCDHLVHIPMAAGVESLNVSVAAGILAYNLRFQTGASGYDP